MAKPTVTHTRSLSVGEKGYVPASCVYVRLPGKGVYIHCRFYADSKNAGNRAVMIERVSADAYRATLPAGFRAEHYSQSAAHLESFQPVGEVVDDEGATHTTMPSKYLVL